MSQGSFKTAGHSANGFQRLMKGATQNDLKDLRCSEITIPFRFPRILKIIIALIVTENTRIHLVTRRRHLLKKK